MSTVIACILFTVGTGLVLRWWILRAWEVCPHNAGRTARCRHPEALSGDGDAARAWIEDRYDYEVVCDQCGKVLSVISL